MAGMNARLNPRIETLFLMASDRYQFISSRFVKEIARLGGPITEFVTPRIAERVMNRRSEARRVWTECVRTCRSRWSPSHSIPYSLLLFLLTFFLRFSVYFLLSLFSLYSFFFCLFLYRSFFF